MCRCIKQPDISREKQVVLKLGCRPKTYSEKAPELGIAIPSATFSDIGCN
jgi:hypothetical protein